MTATSTAQRAAMHPAETPAPGELPQAVERLRLTLIMLGLTLLVMAQSAGNASTDTKIDLVVSPLRFLSRSLRLWDPIGAAGQLQNQAYGYLFPMGPFFAFTHAIGLAPWEMQRLWEAGLVLAAFLGVFVVSGRLGVTGFWPRVGAGLVYALAPRTLSELTSISSELMPVAALPWVLLPLVTGARTGSPRRAAARSAIALLLAGAVNAAATLAILPVPAAWVLTRERGPRRRALMGWWALAVLLACAWWLIPLALLGKYSPPFLDWIESSSTTTLPASLLATLRGVDHWESYLGANVWPAGWIFAAAPATILATTAVAAAGLAGLAARGRPHRVFLWVTLLLGLVLVTAGHTATVGPPGAAIVRQWLDGPLVAFRNVHKFDPLIRLPIAIGVGHLLAGTTLPRRAWVRMARWRVHLPVRALAAAGAVAVGLVAVSPALTNHLVSSQRVTTEPGWWRQAASWLAANSHGARALVVPGSSSPVYLWGGTVDNALQPVATTPWTTRDSVPLTQAGYIRLLDSIEQILSTGAPHPELNALLARSGIGYVVLANDLDTYKSLATPQLFVRATLTHSSGIRLRASFGPRVGGSISSSNILDGGAGVPRPAVEIFQVSGWEGLVGLDPMQRSVVATGSSDTLAQLVSGGLPTSTPVLFGADADHVAGPDPTVVTTDGIRRQQATFGNTFQKSNTLAATQAFGGTRRLARDYLPDNAGTLSAMTYRGIADVTASSSGSDLLAYFNRDPSHAPWAAVDGDARTEWASGGYGAVGQWLQVAFDRPIAARTARIAFAPTSGPLPTQVVVQTDRGFTTDDVLPLPGSQTIVLPGGPTKTLRVTVTHVSDDSPGKSVGIAELTIPGVTPQRALRVPSAADPDMFAFTATPGHRGECIDAERTAVCDPSYVRSGEEDADLERAFRTSTTQQYFPVATVRLSGGASLGAALDAAQPVRAAASSVSSQDPRQRPGAAVDGRADTGWQATAGDVTPTLSLTLKRAERIRGLTITTAAALGVARPLEVTVSAGSQTWRGLLPDDGHVGFDHPVTTRRVTIKVLTASLRKTTSSVTLRTRPLPVGIGEVKIDSETSLPARASLTVKLGCGAGLALEVDGAQRRMQVVASVASVLAGQPVLARPCDSTPVELRAGDHLVGLRATTLASPVSITLRKPNVALTESAAAPGTASVHAWNATQRAVRVDTTAPAFLVIRENANSGWQASLDGHRLASVRIDGWQQGYVVPAGSHGVVTLTYAPQRPFAIGLLIGVAGVLGVLLLAAVRRRRPGPPPAASAGIPSWLLIAGAAAALGLLAGGYALVALGLAGLALGVLGWGRRGFPIWVAAVFLLAAGVLDARTTAYTVFTQANSAGSQLLCVAAVVVAAIGGASRPPRQGRDP
jgi:arabinofuranan 3-O-arabinosyltransferase